MSVPRSIDQANVITAQTIATTTETIVVTGPQLATPKDVWFCEVQWYLQITLGTGGVTCTVRIRKGSTLSGTVIGNPQALTTVAANLSVFSGMVVDTGSFTAFAQYVLTVQVGSASGNSTVNEAVLLATTF